MRITGIRIGRLVIPLLKPFKTALRSTDAVATNIVEVTTDGPFSGYGEAPPTAAITGETDGSIRGAIETRIAAALTGKDAENLNELLDALERSIVGNSSAKAAVDAALHDLWGKCCGMPLYRLLGGSGRVLSTDYTISLNEPEEMARDTKEAVSKGYRALKIKVGSDLALDMARLSAVRKSAGPDILLRADANQGWKPKEAIRAIKFMEDSGLAVELVEQPVASWDIEGLKQVTEAVDTPVMADESARSPRDALKLIASRAADMINIKLMKSGGIRGALAICAMAESAGMECMIGCMMESKISVTAAAHLAMARGVITRCDLDAPILCSEDPVGGGAEYSGTSITVTDSPGLGIESVRNVVWQ
ncbi:MAG: dipeptide epimerase [Synergistaceae bacterium]|jgi:L-alanine-DL-glutamate epimerase-like enolase superfamily enzyme|nr:dipeptide epimerase [Synergistaceae bacterium]